MRNRVFLLLIIALFVLPLLAAGLLVGHWRPATTTNHGELLNPVRPVSHLWLRQASGEEISGAYLQGRWTLVYVGSTEGCDRHCRDGLYSMRQVRLALGKDRERVQTLFMVAAALDETLLAWLQREHPVMTTGVADTPTLELFSRSFPRVAAPGEWIYVIDPLGNLFMRYGAGDNPKGLLEDLRHLLKLSKIG